MVTRREKAGRPVARRGVRPADPPRRQTFDNWPDWIRSTSTFHSSFFRTARFPASPMRTSSPSMATSGQWMHDGQSDIFRPSISFPPFLRAAGVFDVWAHDPSGLPCSSPAVQQGAQVITDGREVQKPLVQFLGLPLHQLADVRARSAPRPLDRDDLLDLIEREPEPLCLAHEGEQVQRFAAVHSIARLRAPTRSQNPRRFVQTQRLSAGPAAFRDLIDQQAIVSHDQSLNLYPRGKVKGGSAQPPERLRPASARRKKLPAVTTRSPGLSPASTWIESPRTGPSFTGRSVKRVSSPSTGT